MFMRRFCSWLCIFAVCCSVLCGSVSAVGIDDIYGGNPWEDFENLPGVDQVFPSEKPIPPGPAYVPGYDLVGEGGGLFSLIPDGNMYFTSYSGNFISYSGYQPHLTLNANSYKIPSQIGSGNEEMFGSSNLFYGVNNNSNVQVNLNFKLADLSLTSSFDVPEGASSLSFKGSLQFLYSVAKGSTAPVTISSVPSRTAYQACSISVAGAVYNGVWNEQSQSFDFDISEIDISSFSGSSVDFVIRFSQSQGYSGWTFSYAGFSGASGYGAIRFMFVDGVNVAFTFPETPGGGFDEESKGLLRTIVDGVKAIVTGIIEMPVKIASAILDGIKSLFIPDEAGLQELKGKYQTLLETKFGFVYQSFQMLGTLFDTVISAWGDHSDYTFEFPGISFSMQGEIFTLVERQVISLDNELMDVLRGFAGTLVSLICVLALVHSMETLFIAIVSGKNYFDFLAMQREAEAEVEASQ